MTSRPFLCLEGALFPDSALLPHADRNPGTVAELALGIHLSERVQNMTDISDVSQDGAHTTRQFGVAGSVQETLYVFSRFNRLCHAPMGFIHSADETVERKLSAGKSLQKGRNSQQSLGDFWVHMVQITTPFPSAKKRGV